MTKASGILFRTRSEGQVLFLKRGPGGDYPGYWCFPGGRQEDGETIEECATREAKEEVGTLPPGARSFLCRSISSVAEQAPPYAPGEEAGVVPLAPASSNEVDFTTYLQVIDDKFEVVKDGEHVGYAWAPPDQPPEPLHPGCSTALQVMAGDELAIARLMSANLITSPYRYKNITLFKLRVTGTGVAYRNAKKDGKGKIVRKEEFCWRDPAIYLNSEFCARCAGLPVIYYHPEKKPMLDSEEFSERGIGAIMFAFIEGNEVWSIARVYDDDAITIMLDQPMSTSPGVLLGGDGSTKLKLEDGTDLLIEGKPTLLDHLAICERGVWDKNGDPVGVVVNDSTEELKMADEVKKDEVKHDAEENGNSKKLDAIMDAVQSMKDGFEKRMDAMETRCDGFEKKEDKDKKDASEKAEDKKDAKKDSDEKEKDKKDEDEKAEDKKDKKDSKKDSKKDEDSDDEEKGKAKEMAADKKDGKEEEEKHDSVETLRAEVAALRAKMPMQVTDEMYSQVLAEQARADDVFAAHGQSAPRPLNGETPTAYRRRVASTLKAHSPAWKGVDLSKIGAEEALNIAVDQIYNDAMTAANAPVDVADGAMIPITRRDRHTGHVVTTFRGRHSFVRDFTAPSRAVTAFETRRNNNNS